MTSRTATAVGIGLLSTTALLLLFADWRFFVAFAIFVLIGAPFFVFARRMEASRTLATVFAFVLTIGVLYVVILTVYECQMASYMKEQLPGMLTPEEFSTLHEEDLFCSTTYSFQRRGKRAAAVAVSGRIYISDDRGP